MKGFLGECLRAGKEKEEGVVYVIPAIECPQSGIQSDRPAGEVGAGAGEPVLGLPLRSDVALVGEAGGGNHDADDCDAYECNEFENHEHIPHASPKSGGNAVQRCHEYQTP